VAVTQVRHRRRRLPHLTGLTGPRSQDPQGFESTRWSVRPGARTVLRVPERRHAAAQGLPDRILGL